MLAFEDNPRRQKVGVCFDQPVPGGSDLGGLCPAMHGFFANVAELVQEDDEHTAGQACIIQALFEVWWGATDGTGSRWGRPCGALGQSCADHPELVGPYPLVQPVHLFRPCPCLCSSGASWSWALGAALCVQRHGFDAFQN